MTDQPQGSAAPTLTEAVLAALDKAEFGYHELSEPEATQIVVTVIDWFQSRGVDLMEAMTNAL